MIGMTVALWLKLERTVLLFILQWPTIEEDHTSGKEVQQISMSDSWVIPIEFSSSFGPSCRKMLKNILGDASQQFKIQPNKHAQRDRTKKVKYIHYESFYKVGQWRNIA